MTLKKTGLFIFFLTAFFHFGNTQVSIAYVSLEELINSHPSSAALNVALEEFQEGLEDSIRVKEAYTQSLYKDYLQKQENGASEEVLKPLEAEIVKLDEETNSYTNQAQKDLEMKRQELYVPILDDITNSLEIIAAKYKLNCIVQPTNLDNVSFVLHAPPGTELTNELRRELGDSTGPQPSDASTFKLTPAEVSIGYTNIELILAAMPARSAVDADVQKYYATLMKDYEAYQESAKVSYNNYQSEKDSGTLSEASLKELESELMSMNDTLNAKGAEMEEKALARKNELLTPVLNKLLAAISKVADENGFTYILNQTVSSGVSTITYGPEKCDITMALCDVLGIYVGDDMKSTIEVKKNLNVGYVNVELVLGQMKEVNEVKVELGVYEASLKDHIALAQNSGASEDLIQKLINEAETKLNSRQSELMEPIMIQIQTRIDELAVELEYDYILNETAMNILHTDPAFTLTDKLMKKVGIVL